MMACKDANRGGNGGKRKVTIGNLLEEYVYAPLSLFIAVLIWGKITISYFATGKLIKLLSRISQFD